MGSHIFGFFWVRQFFIFTVSKLTRMFALQVESKVFFIQFKKQVNSYSFKLRSRKLHICPKVTKMESIIGHRIDYNRVGALRGQRHIPSKNLPPTQKYPAGFAGYINFNLQTRSGELEQAKGACSFLQTRAQISSQQLYIFHCHPIVSDSDSARACVVLAYGVTNFSWAILSEECRTCRAVQTNQQAVLATERERQLTTARVNQTTGLANGRAANWAPEVEISPFRALSRRQMTFPFCC